MTSHTAIAQPVLRLRFARAWLCSVLLAAAATAAAAPPSQHMDRVRLAAEDHPQAALTDATRELAAARSTGNLQDEFWLLLAIARVHQLLENPQAGLRTVAEANSVLQRMADPPRHFPLWLELGAIGSSLSSAKPYDLAQRMAALRSRVKQLDDAALTCDLMGIDVWLLQDARSYDEAWIAAEALERCSREAGQADGVARALIAFGGLAAAMQPASNAATDYLARALQALGNEPARFRRSVVEWEIGMALRERQQPALAMPHLLRAQAISRDINDHAGIAAANITIAHVLIDLGSPGRALAPLREAQTLLQASDDGFRMPGVYELRIRALAALRSSEVLPEIDAARRWDVPSVQPAVRAHLARAMGEGYAAMQKFSLAYAELRRAGTLDKDGKDLARDVQLVRLQVRYEAAQRDAENAALRYQSESALLQLQTQSAQQRALWAALSALLLLLGAAAYFGMQLLKRRRVLADLALRDELTGQPNRRSVYAYGEAQFQQTRQLGGPMSVAMIDLDHFKRVNDEWGHAMGDAVLRAFASAVTGTLRGQDRLGRWGGEEWLLIMPGTGIDELALLFARLRQRFAETRIEGLPARHGFTFSMGGAELRPATASLNELIAEADRQLYLAKNAGRNTLRPLPEASASDHSTQRVFLTAE
jgi:diguanylate cyclase (GGDEF)-like protein